MAASGISKLAQFPVALPTQPLPDGVKAEEVATHFNDLPSLLPGPASYIEGAVWRDSFALTGTLRTFYSPQGITQAWRAASKHSAHPLTDSFQIHKDAGMVTNLPNGSSWVEVRGSFKIKTVSGLVGICSLLISVVPAADRPWKIWSMRTVLDEIEGWPSVTSYTPKIENGSVTNGANGHHESGDEDESYYDVVVVGGGQAGLSTTARLQALGVNYVLLDKYKQIGDSWATRYNSARLHTIREYSHLPFDRTFTADKYQEFLTKDDLARGYRDWANKFGISDHTWTEAELKSGSWHDQKQSWSLNILKSGKQRKLKCKFMVMCTGGGGQVPFMPDIPGKVSFDGEVLHSSRYKSAKAWSGKHGVVIGTANTAHDVAEDMLAAGIASVTMVQRNTTYVLPYEYWQKLSSRTYNGQLPTEVADKLQMSGPNAVGRLMIKGGLDGMAAQESERFDALERAGFKTERYGDLMFHLSERAGGHYMDVGASQKIADGKIKVKQGPPTSYIKNGLAFADGSTLNADVIVWCTGFQVNLRDSIRQMLGNDVGDQIDDFFGIDDEGEVKGAWKLQRKHDVIG